MRHLSKRFLRALRSEVKRTNGDWSAVRSELAQFEKSKSYREALEYECEQKIHHRPSWNELVHYFYSFAIRRGKVFRNFNGGRNS